MGELARALLELSERTWSELDEDERQAFDDWADGVQGVDLYMLLRFARRKWRRKRVSSSQTFEAVNQTKHGKEKGEEK